MSKSWAGGSTRRWRKTRAYILDRDSHRCRNRVPTICTDTATVAHHTRGKTITGDDPRYLVASCEPCNLHIGDPSTHTNCQLCTQLQPDPQPTPRTRW